MPRLDGGLPALHLPVETMNREFDGKLLLSLIAVEKGFDVYLGGRNAMHENMPALKPGIYFAKGARSRARKVFDLLDGFGHSIVALDEEGLVRFDRKHFHFKLDPETLSMPRLLFAWGHDNAEAWSSFEGYRGSPILETGNPRMDMLRPELRDFHKTEVENIQARFGEFVLVNSNFAMVNHFIENKTRYEVAAWAPQEDVDSHRDGMLAHKAKILKAFLAALPEIARAASPAKVVVRPHPSESADAWLEAAEGLDNVVVLHEGPIAPWLIGASAVIHNSCTTAVEAAVVGTPVMLFMPVEDPAYDLELPNAISHRFDTAEELAVAVSSVTAGRGDRSRYVMSPEHERYLDTHVASRAGALAAERIVDEMMTNSAKLAPTRKSLLGGIKARVAFQLWLNKRLKRLKKQPDDAAYFEHKFPSIGEAAVNERLQRMAKALGRFENRRAVRVAPDQFRIV